MDKEKIKLYMIKMYRKFEWLQNRRMCNIFQTIKKKSDNSVVKV